MSVSTNLIFQKKLYFSLIFALFLFDGAMPQNLKFIAMSDSRGTDVGVNSKVLSALVNHAVKNHPDAKFVLFPGDLVDGSKVDPNYTVQQLLRWKEVMKPFYDNPNMIWPKIWLTVGNHEVQHREDEKNFRKLFPNVYNNGPDDEKGLTYSFDVQNCHFTFVTSDRWYYGDINDTTDDRRDWHYIKHLDWIESDFRAARARGIKRIFIMSHEPAFPVGGHLRDALPNLGKDLVLPLDSIRAANLARRDRFWDICKRYGVTAYICGHEHLYGRQKVEGVWQVIAGSSGAPLYNFNPRHGQVKADDGSNFEISYEQAVPYYSALKYFYGPGENSQATRDFVGLKAFEYVVFEVKKNKVEVTAWGAFPVKGTNTSMPSDIQIIDRFAMD